MTGAVTAPGTHGAHTGAPADGGTSAPAARRFLIAAAVTDVRAHPEAARPELTEDVRRITDLFVGELGYRTALDLGPHPTRRQLTEALRAFATDPDRRPDDYVVLYFAAHGITDEDSGRHYLLLHDSDTADPYGTALPTEDLVGGVWNGTAVERLLVLIDACYAEEGADKALHGALDARRFREPVTEHGTTGLVLVSSSRRKEETYTGALSTAFDRAVRARATAGNAPAHISVEHVMAAIRSDPEVPAAQRPGWSLSHATGGIPAFLPNPRHVPDSDGLKLDEIDRIVALAAREREARDQDMRSFFLPRARGTDVVTDDVWDFTGRHAALGDISAWLDPRRTDERLCVVTGDPGSGKSSLLGMVAVLTDPERAAAVPRAGLPPLLPRPGDVDVRVNASHLSTRQLLDALAAAAGCAAASLGALTAHLQTRKTPLVVLVDSLDEALAPHETVGELVVPLTDPERRLPLRLLVGARPHIAARLPDDAPRVDLDSERYADPGAVRAYTRKLLRTPGSVLEAAGDALVDAVAEAVAEAAGRSFLVARITARTVARESRPPDPGDRRWREELPRLPGEAMERDLEQRLGPRAAQARDLLLPLAYAQGAGLPWAGVWPRLAGAITGTPYGDEHLVWLRQEAGSYVVESVESGGSVYRVYHRALIEYLREGRDAARVQRTMTEALRTVEHPYVRQYLALHAAEGGVLDPLVQDAEFVLSADPGQLLAALPALRTAEGRRAGQAVRDMETELRARAGSGADPSARARLRLAAVCRRAGRLADSCDTGEGELPWRARWAAWDPHGGGRRYPGMYIGETGVVVPGGSQGPRYLELESTRGPWWYDLDEGDRHPAHREKEADHRYFRGLTAPPQLPGLAAAWSYDTYLDLARREETKRRFTRLLHVWRGRESTIWVLPADDEGEEGYEGRPLRSVDQLVLLPGRRTPDEPAVAVVRLNDGRVRVYQLGSAPHYPPLTRGQRRSLFEFQIREWEERAHWRRAALSATLLPADVGARVTACAAPSGLPPRTVLLGCEDGRVVLHGTDDRTARSVVRTGHDGPVVSVDLVPGHPQRLVVTTGEDGTVRLSSLSRGEPLRTLLTSPYVTVSAAVHRVGRQWVVAAVTTDGQLHRIDLDSGRPVGLPLRVDPGARVRVAAFDLGPVACVSVEGGARGLQLHDLLTGDRIGGQELRHSADAVCRAGTTVCVGGSDGVVRFWPTAHAADSTRITAHHGGVLALGEVRGPSGAPAVVSVGKDHEIRCWDPLRAHELWRRRVLDPGLWQFPLIGCATVGHTADGRDLVATGEYGGRVRVLVLRDGLPVAEQEFTVPGIVTALTAGRVRDRDVVVAGTDSGRLVCWDAGAGRGWACGPVPDRPAWITALALSPDGSGRLAAGDHDGSVREWSLPTCRPLGAPRRAHRAAVTALAHLGTRLFGFGTDARLVSYEDGWERRMPQSGTSLHATDDGLLCGDETGNVWRVRDTADGRLVEEALDAVRRVSAVAVVARDGAPVVVVGGADGSLQVREAEHGEVVRRLRPVDGADVEQLAAVSWRSPGREPRPLLFARSGNGLLEYWDFGSGDPVRAAGRPLATPVPHQREGARLAVVPDDTGAQSLLSLVPWDEADPWAADSFVDGRVSVHDVARGPIAHQPCSAYDDGKTRLGGPLRAVRCAGRLLVFAPLTDDVVRVLDTTTRRWALLRLPDEGLVDVFALPGEGGDALLVVGQACTRIVPWEAFRARFASSGETPAPHHPAGSRSPLRRPVPPPPVTHEHETPLWGDFAALLPGGDAYALASHRHLAVVGTRTGTVHRALELPSPCTALAAGPHGELAVGTRNGPILFD
ncbi:caspase family protein [Streptomyces sp. NPDC006349]|uniref:caspase family protein n=1 Tax=Streptomyces sp. NPDC006349 TaxID=3156757 RepID=UPI0033A82D05